MRSFITLSLLIFVSALVLAATSFSATSPVKLVGKVGPDETITLTKDGKKVSSLKAGSYLITVKDLAQDHNFDLQGPGVSKRTSVGGVGTSTWKLTLKKGVYRYVCDPHASFMKGSFSVR